MPKDRTCANTPALPRRTFLAAAAAAPLAAPASALTVATNTQSAAYLDGLRAGREQAFAEMAASPGSMMPRHAEDPVVPHFRQWVASRKELLRLIVLPGNGNFDTPECLAVEQQGWAAEAKVASLTATSLQGIAAQTCLAWDHFGPQLTDKAEAAKYVERDLGTQSIASIWRAVTGEDGFPEL
ncbi:hypothetical protein [Fluviibacterium sp. S390]|uniref:hypothetical protein n=1 Tax=Fluviibacterium sp. S390 TaxID=3415139 RepID=UPI003C7E47A2